MNLRPGGARCMALAKTSRTLFRHLRIMPNRAACLALLFAQPAWAQVPDAGRSIRDLESTIPAPPPAAPAPALDVREPSAPASPAADNAAPLATLTVQGFQLDGNRVYDSATLQALLADLVGSQQDLNGLRSAAVRLTAHYQRGGYPLARAYLPAQEIQNGIVRISVLEGVYGQVVLNNASRTRNHVLQPALDALHSGDAVHGAELDRVLLALNDIPGVTAKGTLRAGAVTGSTDLIVNAESGPWISGSVDADNYGGAYTGEYRLSAAANINSPLTLGDQLDVRLLSSDRQQRYYHVDYSLPLGPWSTRVGAGMSAMRYELGREFIYLEAHGRADTANVYIRQTLLRSRDASVQASLQYEHKRLQDDYDAVDYTRAHRVGLWTAALNASANDHFLGGGRNAAYLSYSRGNLRFGDNALRDEDRRFKHAGGRFGMVNASLGRLQHVAGPVQFYGRLRAQWSSKNLNSSEKFSLGGPYGVRAFVPGAASGDQGWQASGELRYLPLPGLQLSAFIDAGAVQANKRSWTDERNRHSLTAFGFGIAHAGPTHLINVSAAWPLQQSMPRTSTDQEPRFWVQATRYF